MIALFRRIYALAGAYKGRLRGAFVCSFLKSLLMHAPIALAYWMLLAFYRGTADAGLCLRLGAALVLCVALQVLFQHLADRLQSATGFLLFADKRMEMGRHLRRLPMGYFTEGNIGKISSVLSTDMVFVEENSMTEVANMMSYLFAQVIMVAFLLCFNVWLGLAALALLGVVALIARAMHGEVVADSAARQEQSERLTRAVLDYAEGIGIIKTYNLLGERSQALSAQFRATCDTSLHFEQAHAPWQRRLHLVYGLGAAVLVGLSLLMHARGALSTVELLGMLLFVFNVFAPIKAFYGNFARLTVMDSCLDRMEDVFAQPELPDAGTAHLPPAGTAPEVEFRNVCFAYGETDVLHDVSFRLDAGQMLALVGPSGGGKSTIANLLTRFWDVKSGQVLVRGVDVRTLPLAELMDHISMVFQRVYLFQDTVYNNIAMGRPDATEAEVIAAAKKARCYDFIMALPDGFQTIVGEGGASLSGGEKQRISIARCILKDAPIVILDEATASVDADNESYIQQAISELCRGKTLLVIAHRLNTIRHADQILVIADGRVAEVGAHEALLAQKGLYAQLVAARASSRGWNRAPASRRTNFSTN